MIFSRDPAFVGRYVYGVRIISLKIGKKKAVCFYRRAFITMQGKVQTLTLVLLY